MGAVVLALAVVWLVTDARVRTWPDNVRMTYARGALGDYLAIRCIEPRDVQFVGVDKTPVVAGRFTGALATIPGTGPIGATALVASVADPHQFRSGRLFAAWLGLTPLQNSSGGKERLGRISTMGDRYLRKLLFVGAMAMVRRAKHKPEAVDPRLADLLARKQVRVAAVALANKMARIVWAIMTRGDIYRAGHIPALAA